MTPSQNIAVLSVVLGALSYGCPEAFSSDGRLYSLSIRGNYTTSSKLFASPDARDEVIRNSYLELDDILGAGMAFRRTISQNVELGLSFEYLSTKTTGFDSRSGLPTEDGYRLYPFELTGYFIIPISSQTFKIYIGGGAGMYLGDRIRKIVDVSTESVGRPASFGIHVVSGMDFFLNEEFSIRGEMKFRDPQFDTESKFSNDKIEYDGHTYTVNTQQFKSKINLDGIVFAVEMVWHFAL